MHSGLISKKDLLSLMNISYGQLYRWKRKNLIPEEWFIKKSVSTGQETYFPKEKIIERIQLILNYKDDVSLDELAYKFTNNINDIYVMKSYMIEHNIVSRPIISRYEEFMGEQNKYDEKDIFTLFIFKEMMISGVLNVEEMKEVTMKLKNIYDSISEEYRFIVKRKLGVSFTFITREKDEMFMDEAVTILDINLGKVIGEIKKLGNI